MKAIGHTLAAPFKAIGLIPKMPKLPSPTPTPTRDDAAALAGAEDELRRRRGGAADIVGSGSGFEPTAPTGKTTLG